MIANIKFLRAAADWNKSRLFNDTSGTSFPCLPNHSASFCLHNNVLIKTNKKPPLSHCYPAGGSKRGESSYAKDQHIADAVLPNLEKEQVNPRYSDFRWF